MIADFVPRARHAIGAAFLCAVLTTATGAADFDVSRYQPAQLRDIAGDVPGQHGVAITRDVPVRTRLSYLGEFRELPEASRRLIATWGDAMGVVGMLDVFRREVRLRQGGRDYWLPVQEPLATTMAAELRAAEQIEVFAIYVGAVDGRAIFLVNGYDHGGSHEHR